MSDLESRAREEGAATEAGAARELAAITSCSDLKEGNDLRLKRRRELYGGDLEATAAVVRTISNRLQYKLQTKAGEEQAHFC